MQKALLSLAAGMAILAGTVCAQPNTAPPLAPATIERTGQELEALIAEGAIVDYVDDGMIRVYFTEEEFVSALERGWAIEWIPEHNAYWKELREQGRKQGDPMLDYHTFAELETALHDYAANYPSLCRLESIGKSVQNRDLWMLKITDNPDDEEDEPAFKYISSMHGDEILGVEVMLDLIDRLLTEYGTNAELTELVNETEIYIMPLMNPDGYEAGTRANANGYDLNRSFPSYRCGDDNSTVGRQPEVAAVINWAAGKSEVLSANFHGGALVANYPFDECSTCNTGCSSSESDDEDTFRQLALAYSLNHGRMSTGSFTDGVTNGAAWYATYGAMQDWNYHWNGCIELTIELENDKTPPVSELPALLAENRASVIEYMKWAHRGIRGLVTDAETGDPVSASIQVAGREFLVYTDPDAGNYHRILLPGTYDIIVTADGYFDPIVVEDIVVTSGNATRIDIQFHQPTSASSWRLY